MSHSNVGQTNLIGTHESVYRDSPIGNLEKVRIVEIMQSPLQQGFYGNIETCLSIGVHYDSALLASEQGIVSTVMSLPNSTAAGAELGRMPRINDVQRNILVKAPLRKILLEGKERNAHNLPVELFAFWAESFEFLYGNVGIVSESHFGNVPHNLSYSILDKIMFVSFGYLKCLLRIGTSGIGMGTQPALPFKQLLPPLPDVLSEVILVQNLPFGGDDGNRKAFAVHINSENVLLRRQFSLVLGEISDNLKPGGKTVGLACPSGLQKVGISLEIAILNNRDRDGFLGKHGELHERHRHIKCLAIAGNVEFEGNSSGFAFASPYRTFNIADNLRIKGGAFLG